MILLVGETAPQEKTNQSKEKLKHVERCVQRGAVSIAYFLLAGAQRIFSEAVFLTSEAVLFGAPAIILIRFVLLVN